MGEQEIKQVLRDLEDQGITLGEIAVEIGCSRPLVSQAIRMKEQPFATAKAERIRQRIAARLGRDPWAAAGEPDSAA